MTGFSDIRGRSNAGINYQVGTTKRPPPNYFIVILSRAVARNL